MERKDAAEQAYTKKQKDRENVLNIKIKRIEAQKESDRKETRNREAQRVQEDIEAEAEKQRMEKFKNSNKRYNSMTDLENG